MLGIQKLKVPKVEITPKLFVVVLSKDGVQKRFSKVAFSLEKAIGQCWYNGGYIYSLRDYIAHSELSVDEINTLFKNFNPNT